MQLPTAQIPTATLTPEEFKKHLAAFLDHITKQKEENRLEHYPSLQKTVYTASRGQVNVRIVAMDADGGSKTCYCFVRVQDGAVLKSASWKAPAKHPRGTIVTDDPKDYGVGLYGADYLR